MNGGGDPGLESPLATSAGEKRAGRTDDLAGAAFAAGTEYPLGFQPGI
jgi:hypothetical protein